MKIRVHTTHDEDAILPENVAEALGLRDGDEIEVVVRGGERLLRKAGGQAPLTIQARWASGTHPDQPTGEAPNTERVLLLTQSLSRRACWQISRGLEKRGAASPPRR